MKNFGRFFLMFLTFSLFVSTATAAPTKLSGKLLKGGKHTVLLLSPNGSVKRVKANSKGAFTFTKLSSKLLKGATLQLIGTTGQYSGPIVLTSVGKKAYLTFSGTAAPNTTEIKLGDITLSSGHGKVKVLSDPLAVNRKKSTKADSKGKPIGAGKSGYTSTAVVTGQKALASTTATTPGGDNDSDGIPDVFDVDDDGDLTIDAADPQSATTTASNNPFTTLYLGMAQTINVNIASVTSSTIDNIISSVGYFALIFYFGQAPDSTATGGHVVCDPSLVYCRRTADGGSSALLTGVSESDPSILNQTWSDYNADGSGYPNLERISNGGGNAFVAGIAPQATTAQFRPGDVFQVNLTNGTSVVSSRTLSLSPYFVTVPALSQYDVGAGLQTVDYSNSNGPGMNSSNPIVLDSNGLMRFSIWRPQRPAIAGAETGSFRDMGHLHYGVLVNGNQEFTCGGLYSALSSTLSESSSLGSGGSPLAQNGANLWPLDDSASDGVPNTSSVIEFTVDLKSCIARAGVSPGMHQVSITAAGEQLNGGANRGAQNIHVTIP